MAPPRNIGPNSIRRHVLRQGDVSVAILNLGCITQDWQVPSANGPVSTVLGYRDPKSYLHNPAYLGTIVGRVANRIAGARFTLNGATHTLVANDGPNTLHGGPGGLSTRLWAMEPDGDHAVQLRLVSPDGDQGFPGRASFSVTISLDGHTLTYEMRATVDRPTPISLAQHNYYTLAPMNDLRDCRLKLAASRCTPNNAASVPLGTVLPVTGTRFDFTRPLRFSETDPEGLGYDINYALDHPGRVAEVTAPSGLHLTLETDQPGLQLYTAQHLHTFHEPLPGQVHAPSSAFCLEPQGFPNAVNTAAFPDVIVTPERPYSQRLTVTIKGGDRQ